MDISNPHQPMIDILNALLRDELAAVETYDQAIAMLTDETIPELEENRCSHIMRVPLLSTRIKELDGVPISVSGAWGSFTELIADGDKMIGRNAALTALEKGEDHCLVDYYQTVAQLDVLSRELVEGVLLPAQERVQRLLSMVIKHKHPVSQH